MCISKNHYFFKRAVTYLPVFLCRLPVRGQWTLRQHRQKPPARWCRQFQVIGQLLWCVLLRRSSFVWWRHRSTWELSLTGRLSLRVRVPGARSRWIVHMNVSKTSLTSLTLLGCEGFEKNMPSVTKSCGWQCDPSRSLLTPEKVTYVECIYVACVTASFFPWSVFRKKT